jgi:hypothetical protein
VVFGRITAVVFLCSVTAFAQDVASLAVSIVDSSGAVVPRAKVTLTDLGRGRISRAETNDVGFLAIDFLQPGEYSLETDKTGFETYKLDRFTLRVRDRQILRLELRVAGAAATSVEVTASAEPVSSDAAQGIVMDQEYVKDLPANGRNAESLLLMAPGVTSAAGGRGDGGFNANGLRSNTNYFTLDGVSLNRPSSGDGFGGGFGPGGGGPPDAGGGSSTEMISIDAMQEMKVQTSSFAPEFGRSPGAQVVMTSRAGTNNFHGALFDYIRSDKFDSNDWFANAGGYPKGRESQERPGGVLGGPIVRNKTFFFISFERLNLEAPESVIADVPDLASRAAASPALQPYINAFPIPNSVELGSGAAQYRAVISNPSSSNSGSVRIDQILSPTSTFFVRVSVNSSKSTSRGSDISSPNVVTSQSSHSLLVTTGATHVFSFGALNDLRVNYSRTSAGRQSTMDDFGGASLLADSLVFPAGITSANGSFNLNVMGLSGYSFGGLTENDQGQINVVDSITKVSRHHTLKAGIDYRELLQTNQRSPYNESVSFNGLAGYTESLLNGVVLNGQVSSNVGTVYPTYKNFSAYGQDTWRATERTTVTWGLRWDVNPAPTTREGPKPLALSTDAFAGVTQNDPIYPTRWFDVAPRFGVAYLSDDTPGREMMLRAGFGVFYDLGYGVVDGAFNGAPYSNVTTVSEAEFPLAPSYLDPPSLPPTRPYGQITTGDPTLQSPVVLQWNGTWEKNLGPGQMLSVGVSGTKGARLMRTQTQPSSNSNAYSFVQEVTNGASSFYNGLQLQFHKRMSSSLQTQISYTWSHAIDTGSSDVAFGGGFASLFNGGERGSSDYDIRHNISFSGSWRLPTPSQGFLSYLVHHWYLDFVAAAHSGLPFDIQGVSSATSSATGLFAQVRPSHNTLPIWVSDPHAPGGRRLNKAAFVIPTGFEQGNLGRNSFRGFSFAQLDLSLRRSIPITERYSISFAAQAYNALNHPNFANPTPSEGANMSSPDFGVMTRMLNQSFGGGVNAAYRSGGPRSVEFSLRFQF